MSGSAMPNGRPRSTTYAFVSGMGEVLKTPADTMRLSALLTDSASVTLVDVPTP